MTPCPAYVARGEGDRTLVFLHGLGGDKTSWRPQIETFSRDFRAVAWDMPGYGDSPPLAEMTFPALAGSLRVLMDHLDTGRAHLVGHSIGGMVAQEFIAAHPDHVASLVLSGTSPAFGPRDGPWQQQFLTRRLNPLKDGKAPADFAADVVAELVGDDPQPEGVEAAVSCMRRVKPDTYRAALSCLVTFDGRDKLAAIAAPTLLLAGEKDTNAPPETMARMGEKIPGAQYRCLPGAGHLANLERPDAFNAALREFLTTIEEERWS